MTIQKPARTAILSLLLIGLVLAAVNMRSPLVMIGSLVPILQSELGLDTATIGYLGALPMPLFALGSLVAPILARRFGLDQMLIAMTALLAVGVASRVWFGVSFLFFGTVLLAFAIGMLNALTAPFIKHYAPNHIALATGIFSLSMSTIAGISAVVIVPMATVMGWQMAMSSWAIFGVLAMAVWLLIHRHGSAQASASTNGRRSTFSPWRTMAAWQIAVLMGVQSFLFYTVASFLPSIAMGYGYTLDAATRLAFGFQIMAPVAILLLTYLIKRGLLLSVAGVFGCICNTIGVAGMLLLPAYFMLWSLVMGFGCAVVFTLSLMLFSLRTSSTENARDLSGMVQAVGYFIAMFGPLCMGMLYEHSGSWQLPLIVLTALMLINLPFGYLASRDDKVDA